MRELTPMGIPLCLEETQQIVAQNVPHDNQQGPSILAERERQMNEAAS